MSDTSKKVIDINQIRSVLPHRYPFLLVDRIIEIRDEHHAVGLKNVTVNEDFFNGHFPGYPVMPGVLIIEALAQVAGVLIKQKEDCRDKLFLFMAMNNVKFRKTVVPGDQLLLDVEIIKMRSRTGNIKGKAIVDNNVVAEADLMFAMVDEE